MLAPASAPRGGLRGDALGVPGITVPAVIALGGTVLPAADRTPADEQSDPLWLWTSGRDVLPEISRLSNVWLILPVAAPCAVVAWLLLEHGARRDLVQLDAARRQCDEA